MKRLVTLQFEYEREYPKALIAVLEPSIRKEFLRLREYAVDILNDKYAFWNKEFGDVDCADDDPLKDFGGTKYCSFIQSKQQKVLDRVNEDHATWLKLYSTEIGDIGGIVCFHGKELTRFTMSMKFVDGSNWEDIE